MPKSKPAIQAATLLAFLTLLILSLYGCDNGQSQSPQSIPAPTATQHTLSVPSDIPTPSPTSGNTAFSLLDDSQAAMSHLKTYHVSMTTEGELATPAPTPASDDDMTFLLPISLEADVALPATERVIANVGRQSDFVDITIGSNDYFKQPSWSQFIDDPMPVPKPGDPRSGPLGQLSLNGAFDTPAQLSTFKKGVTSSSIVGDENIDGVATTHIRFVYDLGRTDDLSHKSMDDIFNKIGAGLDDVTPVPTSTPGSLGQIIRDFWIAKASNYVIRFKVEDSAIKGSTIFTYSRFDEPISPPIQSPANAIPLYPDGTPTPWQP